MSQIALTRSTALPPSSLERVEEGLAWLSGTLALLASTNVAPLADVLDAISGAHPLPGIGQVLLQTDEVADLSFRTAAAYIHEETGLELPDLPDVEQPRDGLLVAWGEGDMLFAYLLVCAGGLVERRRFSVAHELGHLVLHVLLPAARGERPLLFVEGFSQCEEATASEEGEAEDEPTGEPADAALDVRFDDGRAADLPPLEVLEAEANAFAAAFLVPEARCRALADELVLRFGRRRAVLARRMAPEFLVSKSAMVRRLDALVIGEATR